MPNPNLPPQGVFRFPGIEAVISWSYTLSHGIEPGRAVLQIRPQEGDLPADPQTAVITFGDIELDLPFCIIDSATIRRKEGMVVSVVIMDRRWAWKYGKPISGRYNLRNKDGTVYGPTEKTAQELASLLLDAMGEQGYDVSALSTNPRPLRNWNYANPARELETLCEELGCSIVIRSDNTVQIVLLGEGEDLPDGPVRTTEFTFDPPDKPDQMLLVGSPTRYETLFVLEAVGEDIDGQIKKIDDLSYKPSGGWTTEELGGYYNVGLSAALPDTTRELARKTVFKWYRIFATADKATSANPAFSIPGCLTKVTDLWQILPLENGKVDIYTDNDGVEHPMEAEIVGKWWDESMDDQNLSFQHTWTNGFSLDVQRGIAMLSGYCAQLSNGLFTEALLFLKVGHGVKDPKTFIEERYTALADLTGEDEEPTGAGQMVVTREDLVRTVIGNYEENPLSPNVNNLKDFTENTEEVQKETDYYIEAALAQFQNRIGSHREYSGVILAELDGAIRQIQWKGGIDGGATTEISRNSEFSLTVPPFEQRRQKSKTEGMFDATPFGRTPHDYGGGWPTGRVI